MEILEGMLIGLPMGAVLGAAGMWLVNWRKEDNQQARLEARIMRDTAEEDHVPRNNEQPAHISSSRMLGGHTFRR